MNKYTNAYVTLGSIDGAINLKQEEAKHHTKTAEHKREEARGHDNAARMALDFASYAKTLSNKLRADMGLEPWEEDGTVKIALCGGMRSGKDTVADVLVERFGFEKFRFSSGISATGKLLFPEAFEEGAPKPRALFQDIGQGIRQTIDPQAWVKFTMRQIEQSAAKHIVIPDLRQPNEYKALREAGFFIVRVNATEDLRVQRAEEAGDDFKRERFHHETESHYAHYDVDFLIHNEGTLEDLQFQAVELYRAALLAKKEGSSPGVI